MVLPTYQCREAITTAAVKTAVNGISACAPVGSDVSVTLTACASEQTIWLAWINQIKVAFCYIFGQLTTILTTLTTLQNEIDAIQNNMRTPGAVNITAGPASGGGSTVGVVGNDTAGQLTLTTGPSGQTTGVIFTLLFPTNYHTPGTLVLIPYNSDAALADTPPAAIAGTTTIAKSDVSIAAISLQGNTTYIFNYYVAGGT